MRDIDGYRGKSFNSINGHIPYCSEQGWIQAIVLPWKLPYRWFWVLIMAWFNHRLGSKVK
jgi:hypothetical protein